MKRVLAVFVLVGASVQAETLLGTWDVIISPFESGNKTALSIQSTGDVSFVVSTSSSPSRVLGRGVGCSGYFSAPGNAWSMATTSFSVSSFGILKNLNTEDIRDLTRLNFLNDNGLLTLVISVEQGIPAQNNDIFSTIISPSPVSFLLDLPFNYFNPGTYNAVGVNESTGNSISYNMEIVPEPSSLSLLLASGAVLMAGRRREVRLS